MNYEAANFVRKLGAQTVVLDRHVSIDETRHMETI
jgi:collagenase-like PrtC family protease